MVVKFIVHSYFKISGGEHYIQVGRLLQLLRYRYLLMVIYLSSSVVTRLCDRSFTVAGPRMWNLLPALLLFYDDY